MKILSKIIVIVMISVVIYTSLIIYSDLIKISNESLSFQIEYAPLIISSLTFSFFLAILRWHIFLKKSEIIIPKRSTVLIFMAGFSLSIIPGKVGELIKSELLKIKYEIPRKNSVPIIFAEQLYSAIGLIIISCFGIYYFDLSVYVVILFAAIIVAIFTLLLSKKLFIKSSKIFCKIKFLNNFLKDMSESYVVIRQLFSYKILIPSLALSVLFWVFQGISVYLILLSFGINLFDFITLLTVYTSSIMLGVISFLPLGIGVVEGSLVGFMSYQGLEISSALTLVVIIRLIVQWLPITVGFISLRIIHGFGTKDSGIFT